MTDPDPPPHPDPIRVCIEQPALPRYRIPVFAGLARRPGLSVEVLYSGEWGGVPSVEAEGFVARCVHERILLKRPRVLRWVPAVGMAVDPERADVAVLELNSGVLNLVPAARRARRVGMGVVMWGHGYSLRERTLSRKLRSWISRHADAILLYNHQAREKLIEQGHDPERLFVALNCLDQGPIQAAREAWLADPQRLAAFKKQHGLDGGPVILFVSRLTPHCGLDALFREAAMVIKQRPDVVLAVVGDGPEREHLLALAKTLDISDSVRTPGAVYGEPDVAPWFLSGSVFCYPTYLGLSILHAFGYGLPVITSGRLDSQNPEVRALRHGENGLFVDLERSGSLAAAIEELLTDEPRRRRMGEAARQTALERYTMATMVDGFEAAIRYAYQRARERARIR